MPSNKQRNIEYVLWGLPNGSTDRLDEKILSTQCKLPTEIDAVKRKASLDGWHSFRVQILDLDVPPNFGQTIQGD